MASAAAGPLQAEHAVLFEAERKEELRKLHRDRRVLEKQSRAVLKMPTKQCREEVAAVEVRLPLHSKQHAATAFPCLQAFGLGASPCLLCLLRQALLAEERRAARAREARHKLVVDRLRQQLLGQQGAAAELRQQVQCLEQQLLGLSWGQQPTASPGCHQGQPAEGPEAGLGCPALPPCKLRGTVLGGRPCPARGARPAAAAHAGPATDPAAAVDVSTRRCAFQPAHAAPAQPHQGPGVEDAGPRGAAADAQPCADSEELTAAEAAAEHAVGHGWVGPQAPEQDSCGCEQDAAVSAATPADTAGALCSPAQHDPTGPTDRWQEPPELASCGQLPRPAAEQEGQAIRPPDRDAVSPLASSTPAAALAAPGASAAPAPGASPGFHAAMAPAGSTSDDLRRLGRSLLAAGALPAQLSWQEQEGQPDESGNSAGCPPAGGGGTGGEVTAPAPVAEVLHADGRHERVFASGLRETRFANGSTRRALPEGATLTRFANGDLKQELPCGTVQYFYREVASWQVTHPSGVEVYHFPSGQVRPVAATAVARVAWPAAAALEVGSRPGCPDERSA